MIPLDKTYSNMLYLSQLRRAVAKGKTMKTADTVKVQVRYTFDGRNYTEETITVAQAQTTATLVNGLGGMFWWYAETTCNWNLSEI